MPGGRFLPQTLNDLSVDVSLSGVARGDILYRGASKWNNLGAGVNGQLLKTQGPGADPVWATVSSGGGTVTSVGLSLPSSELTVSGSPVTGSGTLTGSWVAKAPGRVLAGPIAAVNVVDGFTDTDNTDLILHVPNVALSGWTRMPYTPGGVFQTVSNQAKSVTLDSGVSRAGYAIDAMVANACVQATITLAATGEAGLVLRHSGTNAFFVVTGYTGDGKLYLYERAPGSFTQVANFTAGVVQGTPFIMKVICAGNVMSFYKDGTLVGTYTSSDYNTNTQFGIFAFQTTHLFDNFSIIPVALSDAFTGTNGTDLTAHALDIGPSAWTKTYTGGVIQINGNQAKVISLDGTSGLAVYVADAATPEATVQATITGVLGGDTGLVFRYTDANNYWAASVQTGATSSSLYVYITSAGVRTQVYGPVAVAGPIAAVPFSLSVSCSGPSYVITVGGVQVLAFNDTFSQTGTKFGLFGFVANGLFDNFVVTPSIIAATPFFRLLTSYDLPVVPLTKGGTAATTQQGAINNLLPAQTVAGSVLGTDGTNAIWTTITQRFTFALALGTPATTGTNLTNQLTVTRPCKIIKAYANAKTGPTGADLIFDINLNGTSIWNATQANRLKITAGSTTGTQTSFDTTASVEGDLLTIDIDQIGSTLAGQDITVTLVVQLTS